MDEIEKYWELASVLVGLCTVLVSGCLYARFVQPFLAHREKAWLVGAVSAFMGIVLYLVPVETYGMVADAIVAVSGLGIMYLADRRAWEQKFFLAAIFYLAEWMAHGIAMLPREILFRGILFSEKVLALSPVGYLCCYLLAEVSYLVIRFLIMWLLFYVFNRTYISKSENMEKKELGIVLATPLSVLVGYIAFTFFMETYLADTGWYVQDIHYEYIWLKAFYQTVSYVAILAEIVFYQKVKAAHRREKEDAVLAEQMESLKKHIREVELLYADIRALKHDMGNHIMTIENLCRQDNRQEALGYLEELAAQFEKTGRGIRSGNPVTDVILTRCQKEAEEKGIWFDCKFFFPKGTAVNAFDISVILNNGLDNAIEGAAGCREPEITIASFQDRSTYLIEIRNTAAESVSLEETGLPRTSKPDGEEHGYGLANIRRVAGKYYGDIIIEQEKGLFILRVMLMLE